MFRGLRPDEIEIRVGTVTAKGVTMLLYKDARCDMNILDETYGEQYWQRDHKQVKENMFCGIGVWNKTLEQWVWKWDCGTESNTEKEKGEASDSFKRACFNLGIGRELYTGGFIFIGCKTKPNGSKHELENKYEFSGAGVSSITYNEENNKREIVGLEISDKNGNVIFKKGTTPKKIDPQADMPESEKVDATQKISKTYIESTETALKKVGWDVDSFLTFMDVDKIADITLEDFVAKAKPAIDKKLK